MNTEKAMAPYSSTVAWKIPWMEEPGELQFAAATQRMSLDDQSLSPGQLFATP